jgi:hypothetical protein
MSAVTREEFLAAVHADPHLQQALKQPDAMAAAVKIAMAAGWKVRDSDLSPSPTLPMEDRPGEALPDQGLPQDGETIDFDGDGVPDAVRKGGRWVLRDFE